MQNCYGENMQQLVPHYARSYDTAMYYWHLLYFILLLMVKPDNQFLYTFCYHIEAPTCRASFIKASSYPSASGASFAQSAGKLPEENWKHVPVVKYCLLKKP